MLHVLNILERIPASKCSLWKNQVSAPLVARLCLGQGSLLLLDLKRGKTKSQTPAVTIDYLALASLGVLKTEFNVFSKVRT